MARSVRLLAIRPIGGRIYVRFSDKNELSFANRAELVAYTRNLDAMFDQSLLRLILLRWWLRQDPTMGDESITSGRTLTVDLDSPNIVTVT